jgi:hypothetical protein
METLAYDLDVRALPDGALARLAAYVAKRSGWSYKYARAAVNGGWAITAVNCHVVEETPVEKTETSPALPFPGLARQQSFAFYAS